MEDTKQETIARSRYVTVQLVARFVQYAAAEIKLGHSSNAADLLRRLAAIVEMRGRAESQ